MNLDLTVAICMYNAEPYIAETLACLNAQTVQGFRLLIVNDCSTDRSVQAVEAYFQRHPRPYELVSFEQNRGLSAGRRFVEEHARTRYLLFVDADDCPCPRLVEKLYGRISADNDLMAVGCYLEYMGSNGEKMKGGIFLGETTKEGFYEKAAKEKLIFMQPTAVYDRLLALRVGGHNTSGFPPGKPRYQDYCEDLDLWTRMSDLYTEGKAIVVVPEVLCRYRKHPAALSANSLGMVLRMRHIKQNLKLRRCGKEELSFMEFRRSLSQAEYKELERKAKAADSLRRAYYALKGKHFLKGVYLLLQSVCSNPQYLIDKIKHNLLRLK